MAQAIRDGTATAVRDGSNKDGIGITAYTIVNHTSEYEHPIVGALLVPGSVKEGDSHHCELSGIYGIVITVQCILDQYAINTGSIHVACDNKQALHVFDPEFLPDTHQANFVLINTLTYLIRTSSITWTCEHVCGY